jgi:transposase
VDKNSLMLLLAQGLSVEKIAERFGKNPSTISYWMTKHGLAAPLRDKHAAKGGIGRDRLEELVGRGLSIAGIADEVGLSKTAARHWLERYELKTTRAGRRFERAVVLAQSASESAVVMLDCASHGETEFIREGRGAYRCRRCRSEAVTRRRRRVKTILVAEAGGGAPCAGMADVAGHWPSTIWIRARSG